MKDFATKNIDFTIIKVNNLCDKMIKVMQENYNSTGKVMNVQDLSNACATKSAAEITKDFVAATSFIISKAIDKTKGSSKGASSLPKQVPLWETSKFDVGQFLS